MKKQQFTIHINAPRNIVWHALWNDTTYREWTSAFTEGSYAESDWNEGSEIRFLSPQSEGMYGIIAKKDEPSYMAFRHEGEIKDGKKMPVSGWSGAMETYALTEKDNGTEVLVELDITEEYAAHFENIWPKALKKLKEIAERPEAKQITIETTINAPADKVWELWNDKDHVVKWNAASPDWHTPKAENDLKEGGKFSYRMEAKDGSFGFDFWGIYDVIKPNERLEYTMGDERKVKINFLSEGNNTRISQTFEAETQNSMEMQRFGWQAILNNFKNYTENN
jgi:uncharacterized protein YndB with AHSA1/START domain